MPNSRYAQVIETSAINFELKSEAEQDVIIDSFRNFLNSLPTSIQFLIRVREVDIDRYLETFAGYKKSEEVYREQITQYCDFIRKLVTGNKILSRRFYLIIPCRYDKSHDFTTIAEQL